MQVAPFFSYPCWHAQENDPGVLEQTEFAPQGLLLAAHSLMSFNSNTLVEII